MSPVNFSFFRSIPTKLKLNGPNLRFTQDPQDGAEQIDRTAVFTAKAIAEFPSESGNADGGYFFSWYLDGNKLDPNNEFVKVENTLAESKLTLSNIGIEDNNKLVYCEVEYLPSNNEGAAFVTPLKSNTATLTAFPELEITKQPESAVVGSDVFAKYSCEAQVLPSTQLQDQEYQWQFNGFDLVDGESRADGFGIVSGTVMKVTSDEGDDFELDFEEVTSFSDWKTNRTYTLVCTGDLTANIYAIGGGGGGSGFRNVKGSAGGAAEGTFTFLENQVYKLQIGAAGADGALYPNGSVIVPGGFPGGGDAPSFGTDFNRSGGGGGYTGLFINSVAHENAILIGAGGGGSTGDPGQGGNGGGEGGTGSNQAGNRSGKGGTQTAGGPGGTSGGSGEDGSKLKGGKGYNGAVGSAGGGAGYYGGGGGAAAGPGTGGGGSAYFNPELVTNGDYERLGSNSPQLNYEQDGSFKLVKVSAVRSATITVSGAKTKDLSIKTEVSEFGADIRCKISSPSVQISPLYTNSVNFQSNKPASVLVLEAYDTINNLYKTSENNLESIDSFTLNSNTFGSQYNLIQFYSKEGNFNFELDIKASRGNNKGSFSGGEGGTSTIQINAKRQTEYTILGISNNSSVFIYEKSRLIACIGQGGDAGTEGNGGDGGGVNVDGRTGGGINPGVGGERPVSGALTTSGVYGSVLSGSNISLYSEDSISSVPNAGRTISCSNGLYYINRGFSPCEDIGDTQIEFVDQNGFTYSQSSLLNRGFKAGYTITDTAGRATDTKSGNGGNGATGGQGGVAGAGGGGGSGYVDAEVVVVSTTSGGNSDLLSSIVFSSK